MRNVLIGLLIGALAGGAIVYFTFVGVPHSEKRPGDAIKPPDAQSHPSAQVVLKEDLLNQVLATIFRQMNPPSFPLASLTGPESDGYTIIQAQQSGCDDRIQILPEGIGVRTGVNFKNGKISAPMAFTGQYNSIFGCIPLTGWAEAHLDLRFDAGQQAVYGMVTVDTVNLDGVNPVVSGIVTPLVQSTLNSRVNPILLLRGDQIGMNVPVASAGGNLKARATDIRAEVKDDGVIFSVDYQFEGQKTSNGV